MKVVYSLIDPETNEIKYVGVTSSNLDKRLLAHVNEAKKSKKKNLKNQWILDLSKRGIVPTLKPLAILPEGHFHLEIESLFIRNLKFNGANLLNKTINSYSYMKKSGNKKTTSPFMIGYLQAAIENAITDLELEKTFTNH